MSHSEIKPYIWTPKDTELTVTLIHDKANPYRVFGQDNYDNPRSMVDNESNDLISDIQFDETFNILKFDSNNFETDTFLDRPGECLSKLTQQNTNFIYNDYEKSVSISDKHSPVYREYLVPTDDISREPSLLRYAHNISHSCHYETNDLKINITNSKVFHELFKTFSKRISKVAIKTEVKSFLKHYVKSVLGEIKMYNLTTSPARSAVVDLAPKTTKTNSNDDLTFQSLLKINYSSKLPLVNVEADDILIVEPICTEQSNEKLSSSLQEPTDFGMYPSIMDTGSYHNGRFTTPLDVELMSNLEDCVAGDFETNSSSCQKSYPTHRAIATSPINLPDLLEDSNTRKFNLLNCMSRHHQKSSGNVKFNEKHKKGKSNSGSLFNRLFNRNKCKSKDSGYSPTPCFLTSLSRESSNLSLDKCQNYSHSGFPMRTGQCDGTGNRNEWLEVDNFSKSYESRDSPRPGNRAVSCQENSKFSNSFSKFESVREEKSKRSHLPNASPPDVSGPNKAVFIID